MEDAIEREYMWAVQALALPVDEQEALFPEFVELGDELAIDYEEAQRPFMRSAAATRLSPAQRHAIAALEVHVEAMSDVELWTMESLCASDEWARLRELAKVVLQQMGWPQEAPPVRGTVIYVNGPD